MATDTMTFHLHHNGEFGENKYIGGSTATVGDMDLDLFSYPVLMEWVKELGYAEIGGVYVRNEKGWQLVAKDADICVCVMTGQTSEFDFFIDCDVDKGIEPMKQMQPHVIVRPKKNPVKARPKIPNKRKFVTIKDINNEKERRLMTSRKKLEFKNAVVSPTKDPKLLGITAAKKNLMEGSGEVQRSGEVTRTRGVKGTREEVKGTGQVKGVNEYEKLRNKNIAENRNKLEEVGLKKHSVKPVQEKPQSCKASTNDKESDNYDPGNDMDQFSDNDQDIVTSKRKKKTKGVVLGSGPRTRSRASRIAVPSSVKEVNKPVEVDKDGEANDDAPKVSTIERLRSMRKNAPGSMAAYLELREREKMQVAMETMESQSQADNLQTEADATPPEEEKKKKTRGKTKLNHIHTRGEKREIKLSDLGQPVDDDDNLISEFSNFLGTTVREFVSLTRSWLEVPQKNILWQYVKDKYIIFEDCYDYVMTTMRDQFRGFKARIKRDHYYKYPTDEERLQNRPREVPLKDFQVLLNYWADEKVAKRAKTNAATRQALTETHTTGSKTFAQICHKMAIERALTAKPDEPPAPITDADVYVKTRKRTTGREYKLPTDVVEKKIEDVEKLLKEGTVEDANELVYGGKDHKHSFLVGRLIEKREPKKRPRARQIPPTIPDQYVTSLTEKIREQIAQEMEEKVAKQVQENVKLMISKLAEKNPELKLDIEDLSVEPSRAKDSIRGNENNTP
ncbi:hypothetical protein OROMI_005974 [Orobanche minor]